MVTLKRRIKIKETGKSRVFKSNAGWRTIRSRRIYFRSGWEVNYAWWLQFLKEQKQIQEWEYEPKTFWFEAIKRGTRSYLPDFKVTRLDGTHFWVEVKGYMDSKSATKIKRFRKYFPKEELKVIDKVWFANHKQTCPLVIERWESAGAEGDINELD